MELRDDLLLLLGIGVLFCFYGLFVIVLAGKDRKDEPFLLIGTFWKIGTKLICISFLGFCFMGYNWVYLILFFSLFLFVPEIFFLVVFTTTKLLRKQKVTETGEFENPDVKVLLYMPLHTYAQLLGICALTGVKNRSRVIASSIDLAVKVATCLSNGGKVSFVKDGKKEREVVLNP